MINLFNPTQDRTAVLTKMGAHVATVYPGKSVTLPDEFASDPQVNYLVGKGILQQVTDGQTPAYNPPPPRVPQSNISYIKSVEVPVARQGQQVVSAVNDGRDFYNGPMEGGAPLTPPAPAPVQADPNIEVIGQQVIHRGGQAQLTNLVKASVQSQASAPPNIIRMQSPGREAALDQGMTQNPLLTGTQSGAIQDSAQMIVGSPIPGQATLVPVDDMVTQQLDQMQAQMNQIWNEHVKQRKYWQIVGSYPLMEEAKREGLIQNVTDPEILKGMAAGEKSGVLLTRIVNKFYQITGQQLIVDRRPQGAPAPTQVPGQNKAKGKAKPKPGAKKPAVVKAAQPAGPQVPEPGVVQDHLV